jgi:hypothetical protein
MSMQLGLVDRWTALGHQITLQRKTGVPSSLRELTFVLDPGCLVRFKSSERDSLLASDKVFFSPLIALCASLKRQIPFRHSIIALALNQKKV